MIFRPSKRYGTNPNNREYLKDGLGGRDSTDLLNSEELRCSSGVAVSYNDNNLLEKELEGDSRNLVDNRVLNTRYAKPQDGLTHLMLTAEDRVRVKQYDSHENFVPVYNDRIEEDKDEDNYTSNFDSPGNQRRIKKTALLLPGNVLDQIMGYYGDSAVMLSLCRGIRHKINIHNGIEMKEKVSFKVSSKTSEEVMEDQPRDEFKITQPLRNEYDSES